MSKLSKPSALNDAKVKTVLNRLHAEADRQLPRLILHYLPKLPGLFLGKGIKWDQTKTEYYNDKYIPIEPDQGEFLYLIARAINAKTIIEFGTSFGISTIYLATAVRDNGGGIVIGTEILHEKVVQARKNIAEAGLETYVDIREGDGLKTLTTLNKTVDLVLIDGWPELALDVLKIIDPFIRPGGIVVSDNVNTFKEPLKDYVDFLQNPANGYRSSTLNLKDGTEFSVKVRRHDEN
ncbi:methyltransferase [Brasilonema octagenarum UFV-E1]|uniref:Methyltransferase n=1 Tax=Brasilonema sennae CENA114 TaxID=415709 RepID=A0A856MQU4_9CYAN|nr:class I SAM-dependent methyltransferase [Brasilonema sennae]QDL11971.1 methyltransferase [Brasilonema sennae CENA114]QDL18346.1 methyltransferase [Brasilonema octagenarum UFV-E1]